jgi:hypothetical protein
MENLAEDELHQRAVGHEAGPLRGRQGSKQTIDAVSGWH